MALCVKNALTQYVAFMIDFFFHIEPHDSDDDDFSDVDEATRNDNKALYNSSNGFTIDQSSANSIMLADSVPGQVPKTGPLAASLFPHVPPYLTFVAHDDKSVVMPPAIKKFLKWKLTTITPIVIRKIILNSGFRLLKRKSIENSTDIRVTSEYDSWFFICLCSISQKPTIGSAHGANT